VTYYVYIIDRVGFIILLLMSTKSMFKFSFSF